MRIQLSSVALDSEEIYKIWKAVPFFSQDFLFCKIYFS